MANYANLIALVNAAIKTNGIQAITGQLLQTVLGEIIGSLGTGYQFIGIATPETEPGTPDQNVCYLAGPGEYVNFDNLEVSAGEIAVLKWNGAWSKEAISLSSAIKITTSLEDLKTEEEGGATFEGQTGHTVAEVVKAGAVMYEDDNGALNYYLVAGTNNLGDVPDKVVFIGHDEMYVVGVDESGEVTSANNYPIAIDAAPTENSHRAVSSGGVYAALAAFSALLAEKANASDVYTKSEMNAALALKFDKANVVQELGNAPDKVMSQKAVNDALSAYAATQVYGVRHFYENASPDLTRIGNPDLHRSLPVQSLMRRCVVNDNGEVVYYLHPDNSAYKEDGSPAVLDGTDGQVMVEVPTHWRKTTLDVYSSAMDTVISLFPIEGGVRIGRYLDSAYEATLDRTNGKLASVVNTSAQYRGGNNTAAWDDTYRSLLGMPATNINLTNFRAYARARGTGWGCYDYNIHLDIFWLFAIEYATLNSQKTFNATLTADGYRQGGLGPGVSFFSNWGNYNSYNPIIPCGFTNSLGNKTGVVTFTLNAEQAEAYGSAHSESVPSYRGIENPFGHIWKWTDGFLVVGNGEYQEVYVCRDPEKYSSSVTADYTDIGHESSSNGFCKHIIASDSALDQAIRVYGDIFDRDDSGSASTFYCDYHYHGNTDGATYGLRVGGNADSEFIGGLACLGAFSAPSLAHARIGSRLCWSE